MDDPPPTAGKNPRYVCNEQGGKHCTKCKSRHYCSKACQLVDWKRGHNKACKQLAADFQDRLLDELMQEKMKIKKEPPIVEDVAPAAGSKARLSAVRTTAAAKASAPNEDAPDWRGTCAICLDVLPKHADEGNATAQIVLGNMYCAGAVGLEQNFERAFHLYELAAAQGHAEGQLALGRCYEDGKGVKIDFKVAAQWYRRAAEQGFSAAQAKLGLAHYVGTGVAQSNDEAVKWSSLASAQGHAGSLFMLGVYYFAGHGVPRDVHEALRLFKVAAAKGHLDARDQAEKLGAFLAAHPSYGRPTHPGS